MLFNLCFNREIPYPEWEDGYSNQPPDDVDDGVEDDAKWIGMGVGPGGRDWMVVVDRDRLRRIAPAGAAVTPSSSASISATGVEEGDTCRRYSRFPVSVERSTAKWSPALTQ